MASWTDIDIANRALILIGANSISDFAGGTTESLVAAQLYEAALENALSLYEWKFATFFADLGEPDATVPDQVWENAYNIPAGVLLTRAVYLNDEPIDYEVSGDQILCDASDPDSPHIRATFNVPESEFPGYFSNYLQLRLAADFAGPITAKAGLVTAYDKLAKDQWLIATLVDAQSATTRKMNTRRLIDQRR